MDHETGHGAYLTRVESSSERIVRRTATCSTSLWLRRIGLWNCQSEISKIDETRGDAVGGTNAPDLLGLLNCTDDGGSRWAETTCRRFSRNELDGRISAAALLAEDATERMQEQGTMDEADDDRVIGKHFADAADPEQELLDSL